MAITPENIEFTPTFLPPIREIKMETDSHLTQFALKREYETLLAELTPDEDLLIEVILADGRVIRATYFGYSTVEMLTVDGFINDQEVSVFLHHTTAQVVFSKIKKTPETPRRPMGFQQD